MAVSRSSGPIMAEVWPTRLRTTGMGSAYGFGGIGKIIGPLGLALMVGASDVITPKATLDAIVPSFTVFRRVDGVVRLRVPVLWFRDRQRSRSPAIDQVLEERGGGRRRPTCQNPETVEPCYQQVAKASRCQSFTRRS